MDVEKFTNFVLANLHNKRWIGQPAIFTLRDRRRRQSPPRHHPAGSSGINALGTPSDAYPPRLDPRVHGGD